MVLLKMVITVCCECIKRWQALGDSVGVSVQFKDKIIKLVELCRPTSEDLAFGEFFSLEIVAPFSIFLKNQFPYILS